MKSEGSSGALDCKLNLDRASSNVLLERLYEMWRKEGYISPRIVLERLRFRRAGRIKQKLVSKISRGRRLPRRFSPTRLEAKITPVLAFRMSIDVKR